MASLKSASIDRRDLRDLPKFAQVKVLLSERLRSMQAGDQLPSIAQLTRAYGVSLATVDRAMKELRQEGLVEVRHGSGSYATGRNRLIYVGVCFNFDILEPEAGTFPRLLLGGLESALPSFESVRLRHYFTAGTGQQWSNRLDTLLTDARNRMIDGAIVIGLRHGEFAELDLPTIGLHDLPGTTARVLLDQSTLVRLGVELLADRGCRRLGLLGPNPHETSPELAGVHDAFLAACQIDDCRPASGFVLGAPPDAGSGVEAAERDGEAAAARYLNLPHGDRPDGIIVTDDHRARGLSQALRGHGVIPGLDIHIVSQANVGSTVLDGMGVIPLIFDAGVIARELLALAVAHITGAPDCPRTVYVPPTPKHESARP